MPRETVYSSAPLLRSPGRLLADARADLQVVPVTAWRLFQRTTQSRYRQTRFGYLWLVLPAIALTLIWVVLERSGVLELGRSAVPYAAYVVSGLVFWQLFLDALNTPLGRLTTAREAVTKTRLPHETWMVAGLMEAVFNFVVRLVVAVPALLLLGVTPDWHVILVPVAAAAVLLLGAAIGLALTPAGLLYQDVAHGLAIASWLLLFLTPVFYTAPDKGLQTKFITYNPLTPLLETGRSWLLGTGGVEVAAFAGVAGAALVLFVAVWLAYRLAKPHLVARM